MTKTDTSSEIIELVTQLVQSHGFNAISYQHIADQIGIRKASIHYHFRTKADLGRAMIQHYRNTLQAVMDAAENEGKSDYTKVWQHYIAPIEAMSSKSDRACLCGVLAAEFDTLSEQMKEEIRTFFTSHQEWLAKLFKTGRDAGSFHFEGDPEAMAKLAFSTLQGAMLIQRATADSTQFKHSIFEVNRALGIV